MRLRTSMCLVLAACGPEVAVDDAGADDTGGTGATSGAMTDPSATAPTSVDDSDDDVVDDGPIIDDFSSTSDLPPLGGCVGGAPCKLDVLVVVDNSSRMGDVQLSLTRSLVELVGRIEARASTGESVVDVQMMFTTTDMGNPLCSPFQQPDYTPAMGSPISTGCLERLNRFTGLGNDPEVREDVCESLCTPDIVPDDPFVAFVGEEDNVPDGLVEDIDGDGDLDSMAAQAVACLAPQGLDGCGYEQPLESMLQALAPEAEWNTGERPFLRPESTLLIVLATDEMDCSMNDFSLMNDEQWYEPDGAGMYLPSSAICWNAGTLCAGPSADGIYSDCAATNEPLLSPDRYRDFLSALRDSSGREVLMIAFTGVPPVEQHDPEPPFEPIAGGLQDLVYRTWEYEDIVPPDLDAGLTLDDKRWTYGIGPACTSYGENSGRLVQAVPNPRVTEVCESLDSDDGVRCCVESVCDAQMPLHCADGWLSGGYFGPPGG